MSGLSPVLEEGLAFPVAQTWTTLEMEGEAAGELLPTWMCFL